MMCVTIGLSKIKAKYLKYEHCQLALVMSFGTCAGQLLYQVAVHVTHKQGSAVNHGIWCSTPMY